MFGYTIAKKRLDKSFKACYRYSQYFSCFYDSSYYQYFLLKNLNESNSNFELFTNLVKVMSLNTNKIVKPDKEYTIMVYDNETGKLIGPASLIMLNELVIIRIHPLMKEEIKVLLMRLKYTLLFDILFSKKINSFQFIGPKSGDQILKVFRSLKLEDDSLLTFKNNLNLNDLEDGQIVLLKLKEPKTQFKMTEFIYNKIIDNLIKESEDSNLMDVDYDQNNLILANNKHLLTEKFFDDYLNDFIELDKMQERDFKCTDIEVPTERTPITRRKKVELSYLNEKIETSKIYKNKSKIKNFTLQVKSNYEYSKNKENTEIVLNDKNIKKNNNEISIDLNTLNKSELQDIIADNKNTINVIIIKNSIQKQIQVNYKIPVFTVIFPRNHALNLFRRFNYVNCKAIGIKELRYYYADTNNLFFPEDYPSTKSYLEFSKQRVNFKYN